MADKAADTSNNTTGEGDDVVVDPAKLYDDKGGESDDDKSTDDDTKGGDDDAGGDDDDDKGSDDKGGEGDDKGGDDDKGESDDNDDDTDDDDTVPEKYTLNVDEDSLLDQADMDRIAADAKAQGLTNGEAQLMVDLESDISTRQHDKMMGQVDDIQAGWLKDAENDPEIGGDAFKENVALSNRVVERLGSEALKVMMDESKYGNHPEVIRIFSTIAKKFMAEDTAVFPKDQAGGEQAMENLFYPDAK